MINLGYCCINTTLQKQKITYSRDMQQKTFIERGILYASELTLKNSEDLIKVIQWNANNNVYVFRLGSGIFPWSNKYDLFDLPDIAIILANLRTAGNLARSSGQRISMHPDHFVKLGSLRPDVVDTSLLELEHQSSILNMMGFAATPYTPLNIHVGMNFSEETAERWCTAAKRLSTGTFNRLVVENDDKSTGFSTVDLTTYIHGKIKVPVTFDYFHHLFHHNNLSSHDAFHMAYATWPEDVTPLFHYSESKKLNEGVDCNPRAHSDYALYKIDDFGCDIDIELEVKMKEIALFKHKELYELHAIKN
jgi:UV DNA damage endonuclease